MNDIVKRNRRLDAAWERVQRQEAQRQDARFVVRAVAVILLWLALAAYYIFVDPGPLTSIIAR